MHTAAESEQERQEFEALLDSGIFDRAPNLAQVLTYVCRKYFEGSAKEIKEYNIAVEALGRPADFNQKTDSIVRVEAHRLRKRLREYYEAEGASHAVRIEIPSGQYAPKFIVQAASEPAPIVETPAPPARVEDVHRGRRWLIPLALLLMGVVAVIIAIRYWPAAPARAVVNAPLRNVPAAAAGSAEIRILAGHPEADYTDRLGRIWRSDQYFQGGSVFDSGNHPISGTREPRLYQSRREGAFSYDIPLPPGVYELRLHFAETLYGEGNVAGGGETSRIFNVFINGQEALHQLDVIGEAGASAAEVRTFKDVEPAGDGKLHLRFEPFTNPAFLNGLEITPGTPGKLRPIRMVARDHAYIDKQGNVWEPDSCARGGQLVSRAENVADAGDPELYRGERFGNITYVIPVPPGKYGVTLHFAETWFGPGRPAGGGVGSRVFDILCNGLALKRNFDIYKEAKGGDRAIRVTSHALEPNAQGQLVIALLPVRNYASADAIEIIDESK